MRRKEAFLRTAVIVMVILGLAGCSGKRDVVSPEAETPDESTRETSEVQKEETYIPEQEDLSELRGMCMITVTENEDYLEKHFYELNEEKKRADEIRIFCIDRNTGHIEIQDQLENKCLFERIAALDEEGNTENYYIYEDESSKPAYCLYLDNNLGYAIPAMVNYY